MTLLIDGNQGIYIPQIFAKWLDTTQLKSQYGNTDENLTECIRICQSGPDHPEYWEAWDDILSTLEFTDGSTLHQDGDLWVLAKDEIPDSEIEIGGYWGTDENGEPFHTWDFEQSIGE